MKQRSNDSGNKSLQGILLDEISQLVIRSNAQSAKSKSQPQLKSQ